MSNHCTVYSKLSDFILMNLIFDAPRPCHLERSEAQPKPDHREGDRNAVGSRAAEKIFLNSSFCILHSAFCI